MAFFSKKSLILLVLLALGAREVKPLLRKLACFGITSFAFYLVTQAYCGNSPKECYDFFVEYCRHPKEIGFPAPCSKFLAQEAISKLLDEMKKGRPLRILEIGSGTGIVTREILSKMTENDVLDCVELERPLCDILERKFVSDPRVKIHCCSILDFTTEQPYDVIISTIPYNLLPLELVKQMWEHTFNLAVENAPISYVALMGGSTLINLKTFGDQNKKFKEHQLFLKKMFDVCGLGVARVVASWPPITVTHLQKKSIEAVKALFKE